MFNDYLEGFLGDKGVRVIVTLHFWVLSFRTSERYTSTPPYSFKASHGQLCAIQIIKRCVREYSRNVNIQSIFLYIRAEMTKIYAEFSLSLEATSCSLFWLTNVQYHHLKHQGLDPLIRSVSRVTAARANPSSVFQLFSFLVVCSGMISKGFGFVAFFTSVKANSVCIQCTICHSNHNTNNNKQWLLIRN